MERVIYEKKDEKLSILHDDANEPDYSRMPKTGREFLDYLEKSTTYEPIENRITNRKSFVAQVIKLTTELSMEVKIIEKDISIEAIIPLYILGIEQYCKSVFERLISIADELAFFSKDNVVQMHLTYYTHETYINGRAVHRLKEKDATH